MLLLSFWCLFESDGLAQVATVQGTVVDDSGAVLPGATIVLARDGANPRETTSDGAAASCSRASNPARTGCACRSTGFEPEDLKLTVEASEPPPLKVRLTLGISEQVIVTGDPTGGVLSPSRNADALEFDPEALRQLPTDMQNLQSLIETFTAAAAAGGVSYVIDGAETGAGDIPPAAIHRLLHQPQSVCGRVPESWKSSCRDRDAQRFAQILSWRRRAVRPQLGARLEERARRDPSGHAAPAFGGHLWRSASEKRMVVFRQRPAARQRRHRRHQRTDAGRSADEQRADDPAADDAFRPRRFPAAQDARALAPLRSLR